MDDYESNFVFATPKHGESQITSMGPGKKKAFLYEKPSKSASKTSRLQGLSSTSVQISQQKKYSMFGLHSEWYRIYMCKYTLYVCNKVECMSWISNSKQAPGMHVTQGVCTHESWLYSILNTVIACRFIRYHIRYVYIRSHTHTAWIHTFVSQHRMSCNTIPYHTIRYHTIPYHVIPYHVILYRIELCCQSCHNILLFP